jgi:hypothetical protein
MAIVKTDVTVERLTRWAQARDDVGPDFHQHASYPARAWTLTPITT